MGPKCGFQLKKLYGTQNFTGKYRTLNTHFNKPNKSNAMELSVAKQVKKYTTFYENTTAGHFIPFRASCICFLSLRLTSLDILQHTNSCNEYRYNISQLYCVLF